jgi:hypothetical protein
VTISFIHCFRQKISDDLQKFRSTENLIGIERPFGHVILRLKYLTPSEWLLSLSVCVCGPGPYYWVTDSYIAVTTILLAAILVLSHYWPLLSIVFAIYFLVSMIINMANVVFLRKVFGEPASFERILLLFIFNVAQVILTFAIWYRYAFGKEAGEALFSAILVFGTIGYPKRADLIVGMQIATDVLLVAIFLAFILGNLRRQD